VLIKAKTNFMNNIYKKKILLILERCNTCISRKYTAVKDPAIAQNKSLVGEASTGSQCSCYISASQNTHIRAYKPQLLVSLRFNKINNLN